MGKRVAKNKLMSRIEGRKIDENGMRREVERVWITILSIDPCSFPDISF